MLRTSTRTSRKWSHGFLFLSWGSYWLWTDWIVVRHSPTRSKAHHTFSPRMVTEAWDEGPSKYHLWWVPGKSLWHQGFFGESPLCDCLSPQCLLPIFYMAGRKNCWTLPSTLMSCALPIRSPALGFLPVLSSSAPQDALDLIFSQLKCFLFNRPQSGWGDTMQQSMQDQLS